MSKQRATIFEAFRENRFNLFVSFCEQKNIVYVDELASSDFDFECLTAIKGMGIGKINDIKARYERVVSVTSYYGSKDKEEYEPTEMVIPEKNDLADKYIYSEINKSLLALDVSYLLGLGVKEKTVESLKSEGINTIEKLKNTTCSKLNSITTPGAYNKLVSISTFLKNDLLSNLKWKFDEISKSEEFEMALFRADGYTLKEIGEMKNNISRERSRQLIGKTLSAISIFMNPFVKEELKDTGFFSVHEFFDLFDNEDFTKIALLWCKNTEDFLYLDFFNLIVPLNDSTKQLTNKLLELAEKLIGEGTNTEDIFPELESYFDELGYPYLTVEGFKNFLLNNGYYSYGDYISKGKAPYGLICAKAIAKHFKNGIKLYEGTDLDKLREIVLKEYGDIGLSDDNRALSSRLTDYTVLCGRGAVIAEENVYIEPSLLNEIKEYIDATEEGEIFYSGVYAKFEPKLNLMSNVDNYNFLHGVLKLYYSDEYDFSNRDFLKKRGDGFKSGKLVDKLVDLILRLQHPITKAEIREHIPGTTDITLTNISTSHNSVFQWEYNSFSCVELLKVSDWDKNVLENAINSILKENKGYCSDNLLYDFVSTQMPEFISLNNIIKPMSLYYVCEILFTDKYDFKRPHIGTKGLFKNMNIKSIALHFLGDPDVFKFSEYNKISKKLKWADSTSGLLFLDLEQDYIRISEDEYLIKDKFIFDDSLIKQVESVVRSLFKTGWVSLKGINDWSAFPKIDFEWNCFLLHSIIEKYINSLKIVESNTKDRRYEKGIVLDTLNPISDYSTLVSNLLKANNITEINEINLRNYLVKNCLTNASVPKELFSCETIEYRDGRFIVR